MAHIRSHHSHPAVIVCVNGHCGVCGVKVPYTLDAVQDIDCYVLCPCLLGMCYACYTEAVDMLDNKITASYYCVDCWDTV